MTHSSSEDERVMTYGRDVGDMFDDFIAYLKGRRFVRVGQGCFREVFHRKGVVVKVPFTTDGITDNRIEAAAWRHYRNNPTNRQLILAPCRLLTNGCLMMVAVSYT